MGQACIMSKSPNNFLNIRSHWLDLFYSNFTHCNMPLYGENYCSSGHNFSSNKFFFFFRNLLSFSLTTLRNLATHEINFPIWTHDPTLHFMMWISDFSHSPTPQVGLMSHFSLASWIGLRLMVYASLYFMKCALFSHPR